MYKSNRMREKGDGSKFELNDLDISYLVFFTIELHFEKQMLKFLELLCSFWKMTVTFTPVLSQKIGSICRDHLIFLFKKLVWFKDSDKIVQLKQSHHHQGQHLSTDKLHSDYMSRATSFKYSFTSDCMGTSGTSQDASIGFRIFVLQIGHEKSCRYSISAAMHLIQNAWRQGRRRSLIFSIQMTQFPSTSDVCVRINWLVDMGSMLLLRPSFVVTINLCRSKVDRNSRNVSSLCLTTCFVTWLTLQHSILISVLQFSKEPRSKSMFRRANAKYSSFSTRRFR